MNNERWYKYNFNQLETMLKTDLENGLSSKEAKRRLKKYRYNELFPRAASDKKSKEKTKLGSVTVLLVLVSIIYYFAVSVNLFNDISVYVVGI